MKMLKECKCVMCKNYIINKDDYFSHKCKAYPHGIPDDIFNQDWTHKYCKSKDYHFEKKENSNAT